MEIAERAYGLIDSKLKTDIDAGSVLCQRHRSRVQNMLISAIKHRDAICLLAGPETGASAVLQSLESEMPVHEIDTVYHSFGNETSKSAVSALNRIARRLCDTHSMGMQVLAIDMLPYIYPADAERFGKAVRLLRRHSVHVIAVLQAENLHIRDAFPEALILTGHDIRFDVQDRKYWEGRLPYEEALRLSGGLPRLMGCTSTFVPEADGLVGDEGAELLGTELDLAVMNILSSFDPGMAAAFSVALLLGHGTFEELREACRLELDCSFRDLALCVPLLETHAESFRCHPAEDLRVLTHMKRFLGSLVVVRQSVRDRVVQILEARGSYDRAALIARTARNERQAAIRVLRLAAEYLNAGAAEHVGWALSLAKDDGSPRLRQQMASCGYDLLCAPLGDALAAYQELARDTRKGAAAERRKLDSLVCLRLSFTSPDRGAKEAARIPAALAEAHCRAWCIFLAGEAVPRHLEGADGQKGLLSEAIAADSSFFQELQHGQRAIWPRVAPERRDVAAAWVRTLRSSAEVLAYGGKGDAELEQQAAFWNSRKDPLPRALVNLAVSIAAWRRQSYAHAHVAKRYAEGAVRELSPGFLGDVAAMMGALGPLREAGGTGCLADAVVTGCGRMLSEVLAGAAPGAAPVQAKRTLPEHLLWLVALLAEGGPTELEQALPGRWRADLEVWQEKDADDGGMDMEIGQGHVAAGARKAEPGHLEISLLGHFEVTVDGEPVLMNRWPRRSSKALLQMLAAKKGHTLRRADVLNSLWPGVNYVDGRPRIYSAVSTLRDVVRQKGTEARFIIGSDGMISLNPATVSCDIDIFEALVKEVLADGTPSRRILEAAGEICDLYQGEMVISALDSSGMMVVRAEELRHEYVDALSRAAQIALAEGSLSTAALFARNASRELPAREDAVIVLLEVYLRQGRSAEAWEAYREFSQHLLDAKGLYPSSRLRSVMDRVWEDTKGTGGPKDQQPPASA